MNKLKKTALALVILALLVTVISFFFPTEMVVSRSVAINTPAATAYAYVSSMANWKKWGGPWHEPGMDYKKVIQGTSGPALGEGSKLIYNQGKGSGSVEIVEAAKDNKLKTLILFEDGGSATGNWTFEQTSAGVKVTWAIGVSLGYNPIKRIMGNLLMDGKVGPLFEKGLSNLKQVSEAEYKPS